MRSWLARHSEDGACHAHKGDWDRCLAANDSKDSTAQNHPQPGSSNSAAKLGLDEAAECLAVEEFFGCMASSDSCSIPMSGLSPARSLEMTDSEHDCSPLVNHKAHAMAVDADAQEAPVDDEELAGLDLQRLQLLLEVHDDWRKQSTCDRRCEIDAAVSAQHASDDTACHKTLQDYRCASETVLLWTVTGGSSYKSEKVRKTSYASLLQLVAADE